MYHVPSAVQCIFGYSDEGREDENGKETSEIPERMGQSGDCLDFCMQMTWFYVVKIGVNRRRF